MDHLVSEVVGFFEAKGFLVSTLKKDSHTVVSVKAEESAGTEIAEVRLIREADGSLTVTFESVEGSSFTRNSSLLSLLGGGILTLKSLKSSEIMERLEKEFWVATDRVMRSF